MTYEDGRRYLKKIIIHSFFYCEHKIFILFEREKFYDLMTNT